MSSFDAGRIVATADLDRTPFQRGLRLVRDEARKFEQEHVTAKVGADTTAAEKDLSTFKQRLESVDRTRAQARVALDNGEATRKLITFQERLEQMRQKVATARVDADTDAAKRRLDELDIQLRKVGLITARPRVNLEGVERANLQLDALGLKLAAVGSGGAGGRGVGGGSGGGGFLSRLPNPSGMALGIGAAIPAAVPFAGLAGGIAGGALSAGASGLLGLGAFGLGAKSSVTTITGDITKLNKLTAQYNAATTNKQRAAVLQKEQTLWKALDPAQRQAVKNVQHLDDAWGRYKKKLEPQTFAVVADGAKIAQTGLKYLLPTAQAVGDELDIMAKRAEHAFKAPFWHQFFGDFLPGEAARSVDALGTTLGNVGTGVAHLVQDFAPLAHLLEGGSTSLSGRFEKWTEGAGPGKFVAWVEKEGPPAAHALEALASGVTGLAKGLAPIGSIELKALTPVLNFIGKLGDEHPAVITALGGALLTLGAGLKAVKLVGAIGGLGGLGRIGGGGGLGGGGGILSKTPVPVYVTNWGGGVPGVPGVPGEKPGALPKVLDYGRKVLPFVKGAGPVALAAGAAYTISTMHDPKNGAADIHTAQTDPAVMKRYQELLAQYQQSHPASTLDIRTAQITDQLIKQAITDVHGYSAAVRRSANDVDTAKSSIAHLRAEFAVLGPAVMRAFGALQKLPSYLQAAEAAAASGGFVIGDNIAKGITIGVQQGAGKISLTTVSVVNGAVHAAHNTASLGDGTTPTHAHRALGGPVRAGELYQVNEAGVELFRPAVNGMIVPHSQVSSARAASQVSSARAATGWAGPAGAALAREFVNALTGGTVQTTFAKVIQTALTRGANAANQLRADMQARTQLGSSITANVMSGASIANATLSNTGDATVGGFLTDQISQLGPFKSALNQLRKKHLDPRLIQQIADAGPQQGLALAQSILSGESGSIKAINKQESTVAGLAGSIGSTVSGAVFEPQIKKDQAALVKAVNQLDRVLTKKLDLSPHAEQMMERAFIRALRQAFPSLHLKDVGHAGAIKIRNG